MEVDEEERNCSPDMFVHEPHQKSGLPRSGAPADKRVLRWLEWEDATPTRISDERFLHA